VTGKRRKDSQHLGDALEHLHVLRDHLTRGPLDDALIRDQEILQNTIDNRLDGFVRLVERLHHTAIATEQ
jgi:hypothetical protein